MIDLLPHVATLTALEVDCPTCEAFDGEPCVPHGGTPPETVHASRTAAAGREYTRRRTEMHGPDPADRRGWCICGAERTYYDDPDRWGRDGEGCRAGVWSDRLQTASR